MHFHPCYSLAGASSLPLDVGYLFLVRSNILQLTVVQQQTVVKCGSAALNMPANLENSAVATGLEKISFHSNPKERQCQRKAVSKNVQTTAQLHSSHMLAK